MHYTTAKQSTREETDSNSALLQCKRGYVASQQLAYLHIHEFTGRMTMKSTPLTVAVAVGMVIAGATISLAAELPTYEVKGLPISPVQAGLLGTANARESVAAPSVPSPHQVSVLTPRKLNTATVAPITTGAVH
jgi:urease accessory protein UreF